MEYEQLLTALHADEFRRRLSSAACTADHEQGMSEEVPSRGAEFDRAGTHRTL